MIKVKNIVKSLQLVLINNKKTMNRIIESDLLSRPGVELAGFFDFFDSKRIVLIGSKEASFLNLLDSGTQIERLKELLQNKPPCIIFSKNVEIKKEFISFGNQYNVAILKSENRTTALSYILYEYLHAKLSPKKTVHGVLVDIHGLGTLIIGKSGIGKSETALELIKRGHLLIADDRIDLFESSKGSIVGFAPEITKKLIEVRGIGIINVVEMFGAGAFREDKKIRLVVELEKWNEETVYDRLGSKKQYIRYFNSEIPKIVIPVLPGRNVATLVETAASNQKLKYLGYDASTMFIRAVTKKAKGE